MQLTTNLGLKKPGGNDYVNVNDLNENSDIIDIAIKALQDGTNDIPTLETINKSIEGAINELKGSLDKVENGSVTLEQLQTVNKTLLGAINELKQGQDSLSTQVTKNTEDIAEVSTQMADKANEIDEARNTTAKDVTGAINELNNKKVEKITGKSLSTNDYTDSEKRKNEDNKNNISELDTELRSHINTSASSIQEGHVQLNNTLTSTSSLQALTAAKGKELKDLVDKKVNSESGKGLSTNDFTNAEKDKLSSLTKSAYAIGEIAIPSVETGTVVSKTIKLGFRPNILMGLYKDATHSEGFIADRDSNVIYNRIYQVKVTVLPDGFDITLTKTGLSGFTILYTAFI